MKEVVMSIEERFKVITVKNEWGIVAYNCSAMQSYGDIVIASKCPRHMLERNVVGRGTRRSQSAHLSTQIVSFRVVFSSV